MTYCLQGTDLWCIQFLFGMIHFIYYHYLFIYYLQVRTEEVRCSHSQTGLVSVSALPSSGGGEQSPNVWESTLNLEINGVFEAFETLKRNRSDSAHF